MGLNATDLTEENGGTHSSVKKADKGLRRRKANDDPAIALVGRPRVLACRSVDRTIADCNRKVIEMQCIQQRICENWVGSLKCATSSPIKKHVRHSMPHSAHGATSLQNLPVVNVVQDSAKASANAYSGTVPNTWPLTVMHPGSWFPALNSRAPKKTMRTMNTKRNDMKTNLKLARKVQWIYLAKSELGSYVCSSTSRCDILSRIRSARVTFLRALVTVN